MIDAAVRAQLIPQWRDPVAGRVARPAAAVEEYRTISSPLNAKPDEK